MARRQQWNKDSAYASLLAGKYKIHLSLRHFLKKLKYG